jgi:hypothetical protein
MGNEVEGSQFFDAFFEFSFFICELAHTHDLLYLFALLLLFLSLLLELLHFLLLALAQFLLFLLCFSLSLQSLPGLGENYCSM